MLIGILVAAALAGCTTPSAGRPIPTSSSSTSRSHDDPTVTTGELPTDGAPKVENPIETDRFEQEPCATLTAGQVQELLGVAPSGEPYDGPLGNACKWRNESTRAEAQIRFMSKDPRGLSPEYASEKEGDWDYFIELSPIEGHPAVARAGSDARTEGFCSIVVGASDEIAFEVVAHLSEANVGKKDPCEIGQLIAGMAIQTMKAG